MTTMNGHTTASSSIGHYLLRSTLYPITTSLCSVDIVMTEELSKPTQTWKGGNSWLELKRVFLTLTLTLLLVLVFTLSLLAQVLLVLEKLFWILLEIATLRLLSRTSMERSTQEMMEFLHVFLPSFAVKQLQLRVNARDQTRSTFSYKEPHVKRGTWTSWFLLQFEFADPALRNEALSILEFSSRASYFPMYFIGSERRVLVFSPLGLVERLTVVQMLKLYTDEHRYVDTVQKAVTWRWHDVHNNCVREFTLQVERNMEEHGQVAVGWLDGNRCYADLHVNSGTGVIATLVKATKGLNIVCDLHRVSQGKVHLTGVTVARLLLATIIICSLMAYLGFNPANKFEGIQFYGVMLSLWTALQAWGFGTLLGSNRVPLLAIVEENKLAVMYGVAHSKGSRNFCAERSSWSTKLFDGSFQLPHVSVLELFFSTHTAITKDLKAFQPAMSCAFISCGTVDNAFEDGHFRIIYWGDMLEADNVTVRASGCIAEDFSVG